jgi:hypothetical protein
MANAYRSHVARAALPVRIDLGYRELPEASRARLRRLGREGSDPRRLARDVGASAILSIAAGLLAAALVVAMAAGLDVTHGQGVRFDRRPPWSAPELWVAVGASLLVGLLLSRGVSLLVRARRSPLGSFWYAHPEYLLACDDDRVTAFPLAALSGRHGDTEIR